MPTMGFDYRPTRDAVAAVGKLVSSPASSQADYDFVLGKVEAEFGRAVADLTDTLLGFDGGVGMIPFLDRNGEAAYGQAALAAIRSPKFIELMKSKEFRKMAVKGRLGESRENHYYDAHLQMVGILGDAWLGLKDPGARADLAHRDRPPEWEQVVEWLSESGFPMTGSLELDLESLAHKAPRELQQARVKHKLGESTDVVKRLLK